MVFYDFYNIYPNWSICQEKRKKKEQIEEGQSSTDENEVTVIKEHILSIQHNQIKCYLTGILFHPFVFFYI